MKNIKLLLGLLVLSIIIGCQKPATDQSQTKVNQDAITSAELEIGLLNLSTDLQNNFQTNKTK